MTDPISTSIQAFLADWTRAEQAGDAGTLDTLLAGDFTAVGPLGFILPKLGWLGRHRSGDMRYETFTIDDPQARELGPVALVTATNNARATYQGRPAAEALRVTLVLTTADRGWQLAAMHMSFIAGTPGAPPIPGAPATSQPATNAGSQS